MKDKRLTTKIFLAITLTMIVLGLAIYVFIYVSFPKKYMKNIKTQVQTKIEECLDDVSNVEQLYDSVQEKLFSISRNEEVSIDVYISDELLYAINSDQAYSIESMQGGVMVDVVADRNEEQYEKISILHSLPDGNVRVDVYIPIVVIENIADVLLSTYPVIIIITFILTVALSMVAARQISGPIVKIISKVNEMSIFRHRPKRTVSEHEIKDEIKLLDAKLEKMYYMLYESHSNMENELKNQMKQEKIKFDFLRMAAHELKTPLTSINGMIEGMYYNISPYNDREKYLQECQKVIGGMNRLIKDMLLSTELNRKYIEESIHIKSSVEKIVDMFAVEHIKRNIKCNISIMDDYNFYTSREIFESALKNIVHNAVVYCDEKGIIDITLRDKELHIFNSCRPLEREEVDKIFEVFYRGTNNNDNGNGLGLYLTKRFFDLLGIDFEFKKSIINECTGMDFVIILQD